MAAVLWDPESRLNIRGEPKFPGGIQCSGRTGLNIRCGWCKHMRAGEVNDVRDARVLLAAMATRPPREVTSETLQHLARLCLCRNHHNKPEQIYRAVREWEDILRTAPSISDAGSTTTAVPSQLTSVAGEDQRHQQQHQGSQQSPDGLASSDSAQTQPSPSQPETNVLSQTQAPEAELAGSIQTAHQSTYDDALAAQYQLSNLQIRHQNIRAAHETLSQQIGERNEQPQDLLARHAVLERENRRLNDLVRDREAELARVREQNASLVQVVQLQGAAAAGGPVPVVVVGPPALLPVAPAPAAVAAAAPPAAVGAGREAGKVAGTPSSWIRRLRARLGIKRRGMIF